VDQKSVGAVRREFWIAQTTSDLIQRRTFDDEKSAMSWVEGMREWYDMKCYHVREVLPGSREITRAEIKHWCLTNFMHDLSIEWECELAIDKLFGAEDTGAK
jgi:hypothetical protein